MPRMHEKVDWDDIKKQISSKAIEYLKKQE
jgi:hypothetical protein